MTRPHGYVHRTQPTETVTLASRVDMDQGAVVLTITDNTDQAAIQAALTAPQAAQLARSLHRHALTLNGVYGAPE